MRFICNVIAYAPNFKQNIFEDSYFSNIMLLCGQVDDLLCYGTWFVLKTNATNNKDVRSVTVHVYWLIFRSRIVHFLIIDPKQLIGNLWDDLKWGNNWVDVCSNSSIIGNKDIIHQEQSLIFEGWLRFPIYS